MIQNINLRKKTTGSIALDIYKDFQKRNIIEPRVRVRFVFFILF